MSSREQLLKRIHEIDEIIQDLRPLAVESPAVEASLDSLSLQREDFEGQLAALGRTQLVFKVDGDVVKNHEIDAGILGKLLNELQQTVTAVGQSIIARATRVGPLDQNLKGATRLSFSGAFPGSVGIELRGRLNDDGPFLVEVDSLLDMSTARIIDALSLVTDERIDDDPFLEAVLPWGSRAYKHLHAWSKVLSENKMTCSLLLTSESGNRSEVSLVGSAARRLTDALSRTLLSDSEEVIEGHLGTVSDFRNRVEIVTPNGQVLTAKVDDELVPTLGKFYSRQVRAVVELHTTRERATDIERTYRIVRKLGLVEHQDENS